MTLPGGACSSISMKQQDPYGAASDFMEWHRNRVAPKPGPRRNQAHNAPVRSHFFRQFVELQQAKIDAKAIPPTGAAARVILVASDASYGEGLPSGLSLVLLRAST